MSRPLLHRLLLRLVPRDLRDDFAAELDDARAADAKGGGRLSSGARANERRWYRRELLRAIGPMLQIRARRIGVSMAGSGWWRPSIVARALSQDARQAVRHLAAAPGFLAGAVLTIALGIGANLAIATVAWQAVLKPLPYPDGDRLVSIWETYAGGTRNSVMPANYRDWRRESSAFDAIAAYTYFRGTADLTGQGDPEQWHIRYVTGDYFRVFAMPPIAGRVLQPDDEQAAPNAVVIGEDVWRRRFNGDPDIAGRSIRLAGRTSTIVGVMPRAFPVSAGRVDVWGLLVLPPEASGPRLAAHYLGVVARLKPDVTVERADDEIRRVAARAAVQFPKENGNLSAAVDSLEGTRGASLRETLTMLAVGAGVVLLVACANVASLQLARGLARQREMAIRAALGASRLRLAVQLVVENMVLSIAGGLAGLVFARLVLDGLATVQDSVRLAAEDGIDVTIVAAASVLSLVAGLLCAAWPAWRVSRGAPLALRQRAATDGHGARFARQALLAAEIALAVVLAVTATLLSISLAKVLRVETGFEPDGLVAFDLSLPPSRYDTFERRDAAVTAIAAAVERLPGVTGVCVINELPFDGQTAGASMTYLPEGQARAISAAPRNVTPGCLRVLGFPLLRGRDFNAVEAGRVALVSARFAEAAWPGQDPIGRRVHLGTKNGALIEIVGVVGDARQSSLEQPNAPQLYEVASERAAFWGDKVVVRAAVPPATLLPAIRGAVRSIDPDQPVARLRLMTDVVARSTDTRRFSAGVIASFAVLALVLAMLGTYSLMAHAVRRRTSELGIRLSLGATPRALVGVVMRQAWPVMAIGGAAGLIGAVWMARLLRGMVFGIAADDPRVLAGVTVALLATAALAAWVPARRAAKTDPVVALRAD